MDGMRDAQVVYPKPDIKKNTALAILIVFGDLAAADSLVTVALNSNAKIG